MGQMNTREFNGKYTINEEIQRSSFAVVYTVRDRNGSVFAMRMMRQNSTLVPFSSHNVNNSQGEDEAASLLSKLDHKFILKIIESFREEESGCCCIITEHWNRNLRQEISQKRKAKQAFSEECIVKWFNIIAEALNHLHKNMIMHRNVKPESMYFFEDGALKLGNFGIARKVDGSNTFVGTQHYMAPEIYHRMPYDMKCDVWGLGVVLYELCSLDADVRKTNKEIPSRYSPKLQSLVNKMVKQEPSERPTMQEVCEIASSNSSAESSRSGELSTTTTDSGYNAGDSAEGEAAEGEKAGDYTLIEKIGKGVSSEVYRAKDKTGKEFALKMIRRHCELYDESSTNADGVLTDICFLSKADHQSILKFIKGFKDEERERWCIVTELCKEDLRQPMNRQKESKQPFDEKTIQNWFEAISSALEYLHDKKIMHRDVRPENILVCDDGKLKLGDFGFAALVAEGVKGVRCGDETYMAPEVLTMKPYDMKCDVWSLGILLYELCVLEINFNNYFDEWTIPVNYSRKLQMTVRRMLEDNPNKRPSIEEVKGMREKEVTGMRERKKSEAPSCAGPTSKNEVSFFSGLRGERKAITSLIRVDEIVHSAASDTIYVKRDKHIRGFKWNAEKKTFTHQFACTPTGDWINSIALAEKLPDGLDQLFISVCSVREKEKHVYKLGGSKMEKTVLLAGTSYIKNESDYWVLGSEPELHILLIHPHNSSLIHIHKNDKRHATVDFSQLISKASIVKIAMIGQNLLLGDMGDLYMFNLSLTTDGASIDRDSKWGPADTDYGFFAALSHSKSADEPKHLYLFTNNVSSTKDGYVTDFQEYRVDLFGIGASFASNPLKSLRVKGWMHPLGLIQSYSECPVLIGRTFPGDNVFAVELNK